MICPECHGSAQRVSSYDGENEYRCSICHSGFTVWAKKYGDA